MRFGTVIFRTDGTEELLKKILRRTGIAAAVLLVVCIGYVIYVMATYYRLPDNQPLNVSQSGEYAQFEDRAPAVTA